jgi:hypothetical protein
MLHISGTVVLAISLDTEGDVTCVQMDSGHPLIVGVAIDSVGRWKFHSYASDGIKKSFCSQVALRLQATEPELALCVYQMRLGVFEPFVVRSEIDGGWRSAAF